MTFDRQDLRKLAEMLLEKARLNLQKHGSLTPVAIVLTEHGEPLPVPLLFADKRGKRDAFDAVKKLCKLTRASACVTILDTWVASAPKDLPEDEREAWLDQFGSVEKVPDRGEAIVVTAYAHGVHLMLMQQYGLMDEKYVFMPSEETDQFEDQYLSSLFRPASTFN